MGYVMVHMASTVVVTSCDQLVTGKFHLTFHKNYVYTCNHLVMFTGLKEVSQHN